MYLKPKGKIRDLVKTTLQTYISEWITDFFVWWYEWSKMPFLSAQLLWASIYCVLLQSCFYIIWWPPHSHAEFFTSLYVWELSLFPCSLLLPQMSQSCTLLFFLLYINVVVGFFFARFKQKKECFPDAWKSSPFFHSKKNLGWSVLYPAEHVFSNGFWVTDFTNRCSKYLFIPLLLTLKQWVRKRSFSVPSVMKL